MTDTYKIDLSVPQTPFELYHLFMDAFHFPEYFGHNADALWDCLWEKFCLNFDIDTTITLTHVRPGSRLVAFELPTALSVFRDLHGQYNVTVLVEQEDGSTVDIAAFLEEYTK